MSRVLRLGLALVIAVAMLSIAGPSADAQGAVWSAAFVYPEEDTLYPDLDGPFGHVSIRVERPGPDRFKEMWLEAKVRANGVELPLFQSDLDDGVRTLSYRLDPCMVPGGSDQPGTTISVTFEAQLFEVRADLSQIDLGKWTGSRELTLGPGTWCQRRPQDTASQIAGTRFPARLSG